MVISSPVLELIECHFSYRHRPCLHRVSATLRSGTMYGLVGPNGSGKTTLINLLTGNTSVDSGRILLHGRDIQDTPKPELARKLAFVPQAAAIDLEYTVEEIVMMGRHPYIGRFGSPSSEDRRQVEAAMQALDVTRLGDRFVTRLSGGERQRVLVARALAQDTAILILDEATANLDIRHAIDIMRILRHRVASDQITVVAAIHDLDLAAAFCQELLVLQDGNLVAAGPVEQLLTPQLMKKVFAVETDIHHRSGHPPQLLYRYDQHV